MDSTFVVPELSGAVAALMDWSAIDAFENTPRHCSRRASENEREKQKIQRLIDSIHGFGSSKDPCWAWEVQYIR